MPIEFTFTPNTLDVAEKFLSTAETLPALLEPANQRILDEGRQLADALYGNRLGPLFVFDNLGASAGEAAHLQMSSDDPRVLAYEYGIRPHEIWAHHIALKFADKQGETLYRRMVHNPGTVAHNLLPTFEEQWGAVCEREWTTGLEEIVTSLGAE